MKITQVLDTSGITRPIVTEYEGTLFEFLQSEYGDNRPPLKIFHTTISPQTVIDLTDDNYAAFNRHYDRVFIVHNPLGVDPVTIGIIIAVSVVATALLVKPPRLPDGTEQKSGSPNNGLSGQTNIARTLERVPEIFGEVKSFPDLINATVFEYVDNVKEQIEYFCIGRGFYDIQSFKSGETLISDIENSTVTIYEPSQTIPDMERVDESVQVTDSTLLAPNTVVIDYVAGVSPFVGWFDSGTNEGVIAASSDVWADLNIGDSVTLTNMTLEDITATLVPPSFLADGTYTISDINTSGTSPYIYEIRLQDADTVVSTWSTYDDYDFGNNQFVVTSGAEIASNFDQTTGPFTVPGDDFDQIWIDLQAPEGIATGSSLNQTKNIDVEFYVEELDSGGTPTGTDFTVSETLTGNDTDPRFYTFKLDNTDGVVSGNNYRVSVRRTTDLNTSSRDAEKIVWTRLAGRKLLSGVDTVGTTRAVVKTRADEQTTSIQERRFNCLATRKTVTWNGSSVVGDIDTGSGLVASRKMADALLHYMLDEKLASVAQSNIDIQGLYDIQTALDAVFSGEKGEFSYTFDNSETPAIEEMRLIADACRTLIIRQGSFFSFKRDQAQSVVRNLFNRRNKKPDSEQKTIRYNVFLDNDGIEFSYFDREDGASRTIKLPDDLESGDPNFGNPESKNPKKIDGVGIANYSQAWDRAQYEYNRIIHQRVNIAATVTADGALLDLNDLIYFADGTRYTGNTYDGEITGYNGLTCQTSEKIAFPGSMEVVLRGEDGQAFPAVPVTAGTGDKEFVFNGTPPTGIYTRGDNDYQRGTLYTMFEAGDEEAQQYLVQRMQPEDDFYWQIELINYAPEYYQADNQTPPNKT